MRKILFGISLPMFVLILAGVSQAQKGTQIRFKKGESSAAVSGSILKGSFNRPAEKVFLFRARKGQIVNVRTISAGQSVNIGFKGLDGSDTAELTVDQNVDIYVTNRGKASRFAFEVTIK